jgi:hypothetical protein
MVVSDLREGHCCILLAEEFTHKTSERMTDYVYSLMQKYAPISKVYVDGSQISWIKSLKAYVGEEVDYHEAIERYKASHCDYTLNMQVLPILFTPNEKRSMLSWTKQMLEDGFLAIDKRFTKLLTALHTCVDTEGIIDKKTTSHDDILDGMCLNCKEYQFR